MELKRKRKNQRKNQFFFFSCLFYSWYITLPVHHCDELIYYDVYLRDCLQILQLILTLPAPCISKGGIKIKVNVNFYFHTTLWCLKRFYEGLKGLHKTF